MTKTKKTHLKPHALFEHSTEMSTEMKMISVRGLNEVVNVGRQMFIEDIQNKCFITHSNQ